ncbi:FGGY-family carbohydrate kinase [uncultured Devosia sp.]|uniref:FGGY-family carbohydrate kinase n=1 Tax=uncultured Devosia sp. TaxID=211434 RepID=UPI0035CC2306
MSATYFIGVDVGTGSARAGVFDATGAMLGSGKHDIDLFRDSGDIAEQSSEDIWQAVARSVREAVRSSGVDPAWIKGIGFDATCSLVVVGEGGQPLPVGAPDAPQRNIIVWMDHRASAQAARINATKHQVLDYVGGTISPEMQTPKLLWLRENRAQTYVAAWQFFDLADYLTWRATGSLVRSVCTLTCKWTYLAHEQRWDPSYFAAVGLDDLAADGFARVGTEVVPGGTRLGDGLTAAAAADFGVPLGTAVGAGLIDAHAGGLGTVGARGGQGSVQSRMAYVFGTSACTMTTTDGPAFVPGVWGPYYSAMVPGLWLNEGGQSAAGAAIEQLVQYHPASPGAREHAEAEGLSLVAWLAREAERAGGAAQAPELIGTIHVVPEFLGNRSPHADPDARALIAGLDMNGGLKTLIGLYLAGLAGLGYGVRQIIAAQAEQNIEIDTIVVSGGAAQSPLVRQILADATGVTVAATDAEEPVLLGAAMLGALAHGHFPDALAAMPAMSALGDQYRPNPAWRAWHTRRGEAFGRLQDAARAIRS